MTSFNIFIGFFTALAGAVLMGLTAATAGAANVTPETGIVFICAGLLMVYCGTHIMNEA